MDDFKDLKYFCVRDGWSDGMEGYPGVLVVLPHYHHHSFSCISTNQESHPTKKDIQQNCLVHAWAAGL